MKTNSSQFKRLALAALLCASVSAARATGDIWINSGPVFTPDNLDYTNVVNNGDFLAISSPLPYDFSNLRNFTNSKTMSGSVGFRFDYAVRNANGTPLGARRLAANFHNRNSGTISAFDGLVSSFQVGSLLQVQATNIVNQGILSVSAAGKLEITGSTVNLSRSGVGVEAISGRGTADNSPSDGQFRPDIAIYDNYWGQTNAQFNTAGIINFFGPLLFAVSPPHRVSNGAATGNVQVGVVDPVSDAYEAVVGGRNLNITNFDGSITNVFVPTNIIRQAVFVGISDPASFTASIRFYPSSSPTNEMQTVAVELSVGTTNTLTAQSAFNTIYFVDRLAGERGRGLVVNSAAGTSRPTNYLVSRIPVVQFLAGTPGNRFITNNFLFDTNWGAAVVNGEYAGYSATVDNLVSRPPNIPAGTVTNLPGRVEISADSLDLTKTRMRAEGLMTIRAGNLINSSNAIVDAQNVNFYLGSTNGNLRVQDLMVESVARLNGDLFAWSGLWTNAITEIITNYDIGTNGPVEAPITNVILVRAHALILDGTALLNIVPVTIHDFQARSTNVTVGTNDRGFVAQTFYLDADSFTLNGSISLGGVIEGLFFTNAPHMKYFTNNGSLTIPDEAHFGDDGPQPYLAFVNRGFLSSEGQFIKSEYAEFGGTNSATGNFGLQSSDAKVEGGRIAAFGDIGFTSSTLKFNRALVESSNRLTINVTGSLFDNGAGSSNTLSARDGFALAVKPATGDLLGTTVRSLANFALVNHLWAGEDRGASQAGFVNNTALGKLVLVKEGFDPFFVFSGTGGANGLYVDYLDLSGLDDFENQIFIDSNLTIYFAAAKLSFLPSGMSAEEYLDGKFGGRLRWVKDFAGPNSSVDVVVNGTQTIKVNRALRDSTTIDSDADGVPNFYDPTPFDGVTISGYYEHGWVWDGYEIEWQAAANTTYRVEYKTNLTSTVWHVLTTVTNTASSNSVLSVVDTVPAGAQRFYRVSYNPNGP